MATKKTFTVTLTVNTPITVVIEQEAATPEEAIAAAKDKILSDRDFEVRDFDGNALEILPSDIEVDLVE